MGGWGSGSRRVGVGCLDDLLPIDIRQLSRRRLLLTGKVSTWTWSMNGAVSLKVHVHVERQRLIMRTSVPNASEVVEHAVELTTTPCNYGGFRTWFLCPCCGSRVAILYANAEFACRRCFPLSYRSQRERSLERSIRRAERIRRRLSWIPGVLNPDGVKPKGMQWKTYAHLKSEHDALVMACLSGVTSQLSRLHRCSKARK